MARRIAWLVWDWLGKLLVLPAVIGALPLAMHLAVEDWAWERRRRGREDGQGETTRKTNPEIKAGRRPA